MNHNLKMEDAQNFTHLFQQTLSAESFKKYCEFLENFLKLKIDLQDFVTGTMDLIKDNKTLVQGFQKFLQNSSHRSTTIAASPAATTSRKKKKNKSKGAPENYSLQQKGKQANRSVGTHKKKRIWEVTDDEEKTRACHKFLQRVEDRVENYQIFKRFVYLVNDYQDHKDVDRVNNQVCELFKNQPELHIEFSGFLADAVEAREQHKEKEKEIDATMSNSSSSAELHLSEFCVKKGIECANLEVHVKKKQKRAIMPEIAVADVTLSEKLNLSEFSDEAALEESALHLELIPIKKRKRSAASDETVSEELNLYDFAGNIISDRKELECEETAASEKEMNTFVSTDLVLAASNCRV